MRGGRSCSTCRAQPPPSAARLQPRACLRCYEVKAPDAFAQGRGRRRSVCRACYDTEAAAKREARRKRRATRKRGGVTERRCSGCHEWKPEADGFYTSSYLADGTAVPDRRCKTCRIRASIEYDRRMRLDPERATEHKSKRAAASRGYRARNLERSRRWQREYWERLKADPERHARYLEGQRIAYRLRRELATGKHVDELATARTRGPVPTSTIGGCLPVEPLMREVKVWLRATGGAEHRVLGALGIDVRTWRRWKAGGAGVQFDTADRVLTGLGLLPWDVWDTDSHGDALEKWGLAAVV